MYKLSDISLIIPTFNRTEDLKETISSFKNNIKNLNEVLIIDQSPDNKTKNYISGLKNQKIRYIHSSVPSLTAARNLGIRKASKKSKIICFFDDDVTVGKNYFDEMIGVFNKHPEAKGVSAYQKPGELDFMSKVENFAKRFFFIEHLKPNSARVLSAYGQEYPSRLDKIIKSQWLNGFNMSYKKEIFRNIKFDENMKRYALGEDFDFSYRVWKKYPDSLYITPFAKINHRASIVERYPTEKMSYTNQINHFYINYKNFNRGFEKIKFYWCLSGILVLRILKFIAGFRRRDWLKLKFFFKSILFAIKNSSHIRRGALSEISP